MTSPTTTFHVNNIPLELKELPQWVLWRYGERDGKRTKMPHQVNGAFARVNDPETWTEFDKAVRAAETGKIVGIGFVFTKNDPYVGLDFDKCVLPDGSIQVNTLEVLRQMDSYTEYSPSLKGLHCIVKADTVVGRRSGLCEIYGSSRYFTVTGLPYSESRSTIEARDESVNSLIGDMNLLAKIEASGQSEKFKRLFAGDITGYPSQSEADMALTAILTYWTNGEFSRIARLFRYSGLMREKWDEVHFSDGETYGRRTVTNAIDTSQSRNTYNGATRGSIALSSASTRDVSFDPEPFWEFSNGACKIKHAALVDYLHSRGFAKLYPPGATASVLVRRTEMVLKEVSIEQIKDFLLQAVTALTDDTSVREALVRGSNVYLSRALVECLPRLTGKFHRDTATEAFIYYPNCAVRVTKHEMKCLDYRDLGGYVWKKSILDRPFIQNKGDLFEPLSSDFGAFLANVTSQDPERLDSLMTAIGYLLHKHKDRSMAKAICFVDEAISEVPSGRSGKSLVCNAISQMVPTVRIDGRNFKFNSSFPFQDIRLGTAVFEFNDIPKNFPFDKLFSVITDDMQVERKNRDRFSLPFEESPKFVLSTNYVIGGQGGSHRDRIFEIEFSDHYNENHKPLDEFEKRFFDDWDAEDWNRFDNLMIFCIGRYLNAGLVDYQHQNLRLKKLIQDTLPEFVEFVTSELPPFKLGIRYDKKAEYKEFLRVYDDLESEVSQRTFTRFVQTYAREMGLDLSETKSGAQRFFTLSRKE